VIATAAFLAVQLGRATVFAGAYDKRDIIVKLFGRTENSQHRVFSFGSIISILGAKIQSRCSKASINTSGTRASSLQFGDL
jgi:hypothetical protein